MHEINPKVMLVGEAPGHKGCAKTGIPFTSESTIALREHPIFRKRTFEYNKIKPQQENTSTIVWSCLREQKITPLLWNIFPFHSHKVNNISSNRTPDKKEIENGLVFVDELKKIFKIKTIVAVGEKAEEGLKKYNAQYIRHPSHGGKQMFIDGIEKLKRENKF